MCITFDLEIMNTIFTVDVEGHIGKDPVRRLIYGETAQGQLCGIDMLMDMLDSHSIRGLFFVDIAEAWDYGKEPISKIIRHIHDRGHDVGVHIHPDHMADRKRLFLGEYTRSEQYEIISRCTDFYSETLFEQPVAFRAGKYGANWDTLEILSELNYKADFSQFLGQKWCRINPPCAKVNVRRLENGLLEVPVTTFISFDCGLYSRIDKVDAEQYLGEFKKVYNGLEKNGNNIMVLFAHSFSFLNWRKNPDLPVFSKHDFNKLNEQLNYICSDDRKGNYTNLRQLIETFSGIQSSDIDSETLYKQKGISQFLWFCMRAIEVLKSRSDIKYRNRHSK